MTRTKDVPDVIGVSATASHFPSVSSRSRQWPRVSTSVCGDVLFALVCVRKRVAGMEGGRVKGEERSGVKEINKVVGWTS